MAKASLTKDDALYWAAPGLARACLLTSCENWMVDNSRAAQAMFDGVAFTAAVAGVLAAAHPWAWSYLEQAPALAVAACEGRSFEHEGVRARSFARFRAACSEGPRLHDLMAMFYLNPVLRRVAPRACLLTSYATLRHLGTLKSTVLGNCIPASPEHHHEWVESLTLWTEVMEDRFNNALAGLTWAALAFGRALERGEAFDAGVIADFYGADQLAGRGDARWNDAWSAQRALHEAVDWHDRLDGDYDVERELSKLGLARDTPVDYGDLPLVLTLDGLEFSALRTPGDLVEEGTVMHHCVKSYVPDLLRGGCRLYSVREGGKRVATLELRRRKARLGGAKIISSCWELAQLRGPWNYDVTPRIKRACGRFVSALRGEGTEIVESDRVLP